MDNFDGNRHKLNVNLTKGTLLRNAEKEIKFEKTNTPSPQPQIQEIKDSVSGTVNERLTSRGVVEVRGYNLKIDGDEQGVGLWFVHENGTETQAEVIIENNCHDSILKQRQLSNQDCYPIFGEQSAQNCQNLYLS